MRVLPPSFSAIAAAALLGSAVPEPVEATRVHEVPADVAVQIYVVPAGERLSVLVRLPLQAVRDIEWPVRGPGYLALDRIQPYLREAAQLWIADYLAFFEDGRPLGEERIEAVRLTLPSDRSFASLEGALAHMRGRLDEAAEIVPEQALFDVHLTVPIRSEGARFSMEPALAHLGLSTLTVVHFHPPDGAERVFQYAGNPGPVRLDPTWIQAAGSFVRMGFAHILQGIDHLLFILCLVIPFRRVLPLVPVVTAFTVAHSLTLAAAALGLVPRALWFGPLVETLIAASIVWMAIENIMGAQVARRWVVAFGFGLIHGFGFSFALAESLQFAGGHLVTALLSFNLGVELGQIAVLLVAVPLLAVLVRRTRERAAIIVLSALVLHTAWHWMTARGGELVRFRPAPPVVDALFWAALFRWAALALAAVGVAWGLAALYRRWGWARSGEALDPHGT